MRLLLAVVALTCLAAVTSGRHAVFLNHFYVVLDSSTAQDIENSPFLKNEFAAFEKRTTVRTDETYTGLYFYGTHTYFELFDVATRKDGRIGDSGIAFGVEQTGALNGLEALMKKKDSDVAQSTITREWKGRQIPWFYRLQPADPEPGLKTWVMEYRPDFLVNWRPEADQLRQGIKREQLLERYRNVLKQVPPHPCLADVTGLVVALTPQGKVRFEHDAALWGIADLDIHIVPASPSDHGIRQILFRLNRLPDGAKEYRFGPKSALHFGPGKTARWTF